MGKFMKQCKKTRSEQQCVTESSLGDRFIFSFPIIVINQAKYCQLSSVVGLPGVLCGRTQRLFPGLAVIGELWLPLGVEGESQKNRFPMGGCRRGTSSPQVISSLFPTPSKPGHHNVLPTMCQHPGVGESRFNGNAREQET